MSLRQRLKAELLERWETVVQLSRETNREIYASALIVSFSLGLASFNHETKRANYIPISFCEISQLEDMALAARGEIETRAGHDKTAKDHGKLDPLTRYYCNENELNAFIFEAWNDDGVFPRLPQYHSQHFGRKLDEAIRYRTFRHTLQDYFDATSYTANEALLALQDVQTVNDGVAPAVASLDKAWNYHYIDEEHEECTKTSSTDSEGNVTESESCHTVCDYRDHFWDYDPTEGARAAVTLQAIAQRQPTIDYIAIREPTSVGPENESVIRDGMRLKENNENASQAEVLAKARLFKAGSAYETNIHDARAIWERVSGPDRLAWSQAHRTAESDHDRTMLCMATTGPAEYELAREISARGAELIGRTNNILDPIEYVKNSTAQFERKAKIFTIQSGGLSAEARGFTQEEVGREVTGQDVLREAQKRYTMNFPAGNDVKQFRLGMILLWGSLGLALGGAGGYVADKALDRFFHKQRTPQYGRVWTEHKDRKQRIYVSPY